LNQRYYSLDVFRGATVCLMILVNNPGSWNHIYPPLDHAEWHGLTPTDLVFPFFLFAIGIAFSFVMPKYEANSGLFWKKIIKRSLLIFLIGLFLQWYPFVRWNDGHLVFREWVDSKNRENGVRILGVLQRIALCYFFGSIIIYYLKPRRSLYVGLILLLLYWLLCILGNPADPFGRMGWFGTDIDKQILHVPHMYKGEGYPFDPEGIMSTISAIVEVIFGYLIGDYIQKKGKNFEMISGLFVAGVAMILTGFCWDMVFPINKKIWTSSFVLNTVGLDCMILACVIYLVDFLGIKKGVYFFQVFGRNPLPIYLLSELLVILLYMFRVGDTSLYEWLYQNIFAHAGAYTGSLLFAIAYMLLCWSVGYILDRKKIYIKV